MARGDYQAPCGRSVAPGKLVRKADGFSMPLFVHYLWRALRSGNSRQYGN